MKKTKQQKQWNKKEKKRIFVVEFIVVFSKQPTAI